MTTLWGSLESGILINIGVLAGYDKLLDSRILILLAQANFQQKINILSSLCELLAPEYPNLKSYHETIKLIESAQKARNKFAHNSIHFNEETTKMNLSTYSSRGKLKLNVEVVELSDVQEVSAKIHEALCSLHLLITQKEIKPVWDRN